MAAHNQKTYKIHVSMQGPSQFVYFDGYFRSKYIYCMPETKYTKFNAQYIGGIFHEAYFNRAVYTFVDKTIEIHFSLHTELTKQNYDLYDAAVFVYTGYYGNHYGCTKFRVTGDYLLNNWWTTISQNSKIQKFILSEDYRDNPSAGIIIKDHQDLIFLDGTATDISIGKLIDSVCQSESMEKDVPEAETVKYFSKDPREDPKKELTKKDNKEYKSEEKICPDKPETSDQDHNFFIPIYDETKSVCRTIPIYRNPEEVLISEIYEDIIHFLEMETHTLVLQINTTTYLGSTKVPISLKYNSFFDRRSDLKLAELKNLSLFTISYKE